MISRGNCFLLALTILFAISLFFTFACEEGDDDDDGGKNTIGADDDTSDDDDSIDDDATDDDDDDDDTVPPDNFTCSKAGLEERSFDDATPGTDLYDIAADFTVNTTVGQWNFKEKWTGCETYLFIPDKPQSMQSPTWAEPLWSRDISTFLPKLPVNTHVFFVSTSSLELTREEALADVKELADEYITGLSQDDQDRWYHRIHYVTDAAKDMEGWLGEVVGRKWGLGIDRFQKIRYIGAYADPLRYSSSNGWFESNISMAANEPIYYNFEAERQAEMDSADATVISVFDQEVIEDPGWAGVRGSADITFPDATTMADFDTMEFDLYLDCVGDGEVGSCPAWDYLVYLYLCHEGDPETCDTEFGRWITTYHREGRWVHDVSGFLPLIASGGERRLEFYTTQKYEVSLNIRLSTKAKAAKPVETMPLFFASSFGLDYNDLFDPQDIFIPQDATKVEIATVISGHGGASPGNCAEFCNTTHHFFVNGNENIREFTEAGTTYDCMDKTNQGTVPNQFGTWWYGRSGWCPGLEVPLVPIDVTSQVVLNDDNTFDYEGYYLGAPYTGSGASIRLQSWVVIYKD